jgi:hypothetical protein
MSDVSTPLAAEDATIEEQSAPVPEVRVVVSFVDGSDIDAALATIRRQVYESVTGVVVVASEELELPEDVTRAESLEQAITETGHDVEYLWLVQSDARPRPDALAALVAETDRSHASLGGSKILVAGTAGELESIGGATDVFGEPYSGLDEGEIDLQQYDVVREVAFVSAVSMLVRRDLAQGLRGLDPRLPTGAAGLDFSQRIRLAGGKVLTVPSSEVYHQVRGELQPGWRERAGRYRAMLKAYRVLTLAWVVPYGILVGLLDSIASLLLLRWRPMVGYAAATAWNVLHLPSTIRERLKFRNVRAVGDEELFRFQARGSIRLRSLGSDFGDRMLFMFDDDHALVQGSRRVWASPGIWGAVGAALVVFFSARWILLNGMPDSGFNFGFEEGGTALDRFLGGWNDSGLGSPASVHPGVGLTGLVSWLWPGGEDAARTILTLGLAAIGIVGMGRLAGRLDFRGPGRYLSGLVLLAGPGTALATGRGGWLALASASLLPWAVRAVFVHNPSQRSLRLPRVGSVLFFGLTLGALSPVLVLAPALIAIGWRLNGGRRARLLLAGVSLVGVLSSVSFIVADQGWLLDPDRRLGLGVDWIWPALVAVAAVALALVRDRTSNLAVLGGVIGLGGMIVVKTGPAGPGVEEAALVLASFGAALVVAAAFNVRSRQPLRLLAVLAGVLALALSAGTLGNGRLGFPDGRENERFAYASTLADEGGPGRILVISADRKAISGEARRGPGLWYRIVDGSGMSLDEVWLPPPLPGDEALDDAIARIASGAELRPGSLLAEFAIAWVVVEGGPEYLTEILESQLDLVPVPLDPGSLVLENPEAIPLAVSGIEVWERDGADFVGESSTDRVVIATNFAEGWLPSVGESEWAVSVSAERGRASYDGSGLHRTAPMAAGLVFLVSIGMMLARRWLP